MKRNLLLLSLLAYSIAQTTPSSGYDENWFVPDIVTTKADPYNMFVKDFGQPSGQYNWLADQFQLMVNKET